MTPAQHPLRCETCDFFKAKYKCPGYWGQKMKKDDTDHSLSNALRDREFEITSRIGCASHSDSDKVLNKLIDIMDHYQDDTYYKRCLQEVRQTISQFRQQSKGRGEQR